MSDTRDREMYYYATMLDDGTVLRVSKNMESLAGTAFRMLPVMFLIAAVMILLTVILASWQTRRLKMCIRDSPWGDHCAKRRAKHRRMEEQV